MSSNLIVYGAPLSLAPVGDTSSRFYQNVGYGDQSPLGVDEIQPGDVLKEPYVNESNVCTCMGVGQCRHPAAPESTLSRRTSSIPGSSRVRSRRPGSLIYNLYMSSLMSRFKICLVAKRWANASKECLKGGRCSGEMVIDWRSRDTSENQPRVQPVE
jgi:hypothetical protein